MVRLTRFHTHRQERGITLVLVVILIFAMIGVAALLIDAVTLYVSKAEAQRVADAAALAGAKALVDDGVTADPANSATQWSVGCTAATAQAKEVATLGRIGGVAPPSSSVNVCFRSGGVGPCTATCPLTGTAGSGFGVNPQVGVTLQSSPLPLFFAKIWGQQTATVSATSLAEGFNPSGTNVPVAAKCIMPWLVANIDPNRSTNPGPVIVPIIDVATGQITKPGPTPAGIIGDVIALGCTTAGACSTSSTPTFNPGSSPARVTYYPLDLGPPAASGPSCSLGGWNNYQKNMVACSPTPIACGTQVNLATAITVTAAANRAAVDCLIGASASGLGNGQDTLNTASFPFTMHAGNNNPLQAGGIVTTGDIISSSRSVVTIPVYDSSSGAVPPTSATVIGFVQGFVESVSTNSGRPRIRVLNVSGCGTGATGTPVGTNEASAVPVRLIH